MVLIPCIFLKVKRKEYRKLLQFVYTYFYGLLQFKCRAFLEIRYVERE